MKMLWNLLKKRKARGRMNEIDYFQCEHCGFIIDSLEVKYAKINLLEYCPRCKDYPQPFRHISIKEQTNEK